MTTRTPTQNERSELSKTWRGRAWTHLVAVALGVLPLYAGVIVHHLRSDHTVPIQAFVFYLAVIAPLAIVITVLLLRFLCGEKPRELNLSQGKWSSDILAALLLSPVIMVANVVSTYVFSELFPASASDPSVRNLFAELAGNPRLLVLFLALLIPLGAASEEVTRTFLLSRLWKVWPSNTGKWLAVGMSACLFGLIHLYRGPVSVAWTTVFGLIAAYYYLRFGRVVPLILAHYLTNGLQVVVFAAMVR